MNEVGREGGSKMLPRGSMGPARSDRCEGNQAAAPWVKLSRVTECGPRGQNNRRLLWTSRFRLEASDSVCFFRGEPGSPFFIPPTLTDGPNHCNKASRKNFLSPWRGDTGWFDFGVDSIYLMHECLGFSFFPLDGLFSFSTLASPRVEWRLPFPFSRALLCFFVQ